MRPRILSRQHRQTGRFALFCFLCAVLALAGCSRAPREVQLTGDTMGTTYHITLVDWPASVQPDEVHLAIERLLKQVDHEMSNYSESSVLSQFNRVPPGQWFPVTPWLAEVVAIAQSVSAASGGAYDITVSPLVSAWGFGPKPARELSAGPQAPPEAAALEKARAEVGWQYLEYQADPPALRKQRWLTLDLSSIAPGYAVDRIAGLLAARGITRYLVEVGGELRVAGMNAAGEPWRLGIEDPQAVVPGQFRTALALSQEGMATSGNYRQFLEWQGVRYSHTIDPRTGMAVSHGLVSVTVLAPSAALADAWATAFAVLGEADTLALASAQQLPVYLLVRDGDRLVPRHNPLLQPYLEAAR